MAGWRVVVYAGVMALFLQTWSVAGEEVSGELQALKLGKGELDWVEVTKTDAWEWPMGKDTAAKGFSQEMVMKKEVPATLRVAVFKDEAEAAEASRLYVLNAGADFHEGLWEKAGMEKVGDQCWHSVRKDRVQLVVISGAMGIAIDETFREPSYEVTDLAREILKKRSAWRLEEVRRKEYRDAPLREGDIAGLKAVHFRATTGPIWGERAEKKDGGGVPGLRQLVTLDGTSMEIAYMVYENAEKAQAGAEAAIKQLKSRTAVPFYKAGLWEGAASKAIGDACWYGAGDRKMERPAQLVVRTGRLCFVIYGIGGADGRKVLPGPAEAIVKKWKAAGE